MSDEMFRIAQTEGAQSFQPARMQTAASTLNLDTAKFATCFGSGETQVTLKTTDQVSQQLGVTSTPSLLSSVDGGKTFQWLSSVDADGTHHPPSPDDIIAAINNANA